MRCGSVFDKYEVTPQGEKLADYCLKVIENKDYTYSDYAEMLIYEEFEILVKKTGMDREKTAWFTLSVFMGI